MKIHADSIRTITVSSLGSAVLIAGMKSRVLWVVKPCSLIIMYGRFGEEPAAFNIRVHGSQRFVRNVDIYLLYYGQYS
jgi:hypothetical protein